MKELKEYVLEQTFTGETDLQLIQRFLCTEGLQLEALAMIPALAKDRADKIEQKFNNVKSWAPYIIGLKRLNAHKIKMTDEVADKLEKLSLMYLCDYDLKESGMYDWAKENVPKMKVPFFYFRPTVDWLAKYGIYFEGEEKDNITLGGNDNAGKEG